MKKNPVTRTLMATAAGVTRWQIEAGHTEISAAKYLGIGHRTFARYKALGLPNKYGASVIQRDAILDRMENALKPKRLQGEHRGIC